MMTSCLQSTDEGLQMLCLNLHLRTDKYSAEGIIFNHTMIYLLFPCIGVTWAPECWASAGGHGECFSSLVWLWSCVNRWTFLQ